jgi:dimethylhistidine N-methyltransferase
MSSALDLSGRPSAEMLRPQPAASRPLIAVVFEGLSEEYKRLPSVLLYDAEGARLYERVCEQPEHYVARCEAALLQTHGAEIAEFVGAQAAVVEYGVGTAHASGLLLGALPAPHSYLPVDVEPGRLARACAAARSRLRTLRVHPLCQDYRDLLVLPPVVGSAQRRLAFFPHSGLGNFRPLEVVALLNEVRERMSDRGALLAGVDLAPSPEVLQRAYDDAAGAMAAFNLNLLRRVNRELDATFDLRAFEHQAVWNAVDRRLEIGLVSLRAQNPTVAGIGVGFAAEERIVTGFCYRHTPEEFGKLARIAGWSVRRSWVDEATGYSLQYLEAGDA